MSETETTDQLEIGKPERERFMDNSNSKQRVRRIAIDPDPKGDRKSVGGADHDDWNDWLVQNTAAALPIDQRDEAAAVGATVALYSGMIDLKPADPIEGVLISQLMTANQASLSLYRRAWAQPPEYLEARFRYLALADKAARTTMMLTERLDNHRNKGKQQIVVQHTTTVNANQAVVTDSVNTGKTKEADSSAMLLAATTERPMKVLETEKQNEAVPVAGGGTKAE
jgi:hypothetical protein